MDPNDKILQFPKSSQNDQRLLHTVLDNMSQGILLFDSEQRLILCNQRYIDMYGLPIDTVQPGCTLRDLLICRKQTDTFADDPVEYIARLTESITEQKSFSHITNLADGRIISVVSTSVDGGGWLATHEDITERRCAEERIGHMARHDGLTDLPNRTLLRERLEHELKRVKRGERLAVLCLDLDQFKSVNDTLGHPVGDELLKLVAERLRGCTREPDTIARLGGDEFAIVMTQIQEPTDAAILSRRIREVSR